MLPIGSVAAEKRNPNEVPRLEVRFRVMGMKYVVRNLCYFNGEEFIPFNASRSRPTQWMDYSGSGPVLFFRDEEVKAWQEASEEKPEVEKPRPVAQFTPGTSGDWVLIFVRISADDERYTYRIVPIPDNAGKVKEGLRFYNLSNKELAIEVTDSMLRLQSGEQGHMNPPPREHNAMVMKIAALHDTGWEIASSTVFGHRPNACITFYVLEQEGRVQFVRFVDRIPTENDVLEQEK